MDRLIIEPNVAEGLDFHIPKGYVYFAMAVSVAVVAALGM
jgi:hypothetical protein